MKLEFTDKDEINYIKDLVNKDVIQFKEKFLNRQKVQSKIYFAMELGDFN